MIILIEPLCRDASHEVFNAGFVELFSQAFPTDNIVYCAEKTQIDCVRNALGETTTNGGEIEWSMFASLLFYGVAFKVTVAALDTPIMYLCTYFVRKRFDLKPGEEISLV